MIENEFELGVCLLSTDEAAAAACLIRNIQRNPQRQR